MALVDYSDSESSDVEDRSDLSPPETGSAQPDSRSNFQKVVDKSNPHRIRVNLPTAVSENGDMHNAEDEHPAKRIRHGDGSAFSGFNSILPAPKKPQAPGPSGSHGKPKAGSGSRGMALKTSAAPGFERSQSERVDEAANGESVGDREARNEDMSLSPGGEETSVNNTSKVEMEVKPIGKNTMFRPLSVSRKPPKKKAASAKPTPAPAANVSISTSAPAPRSINDEKRSKVSLFSLSTQEKPEASTNTLNASYQPMLYFSTTQDPSNTVNGEEGSELYEGWRESELDTNSPAKPEQATESTDPSSLSSIAQDLNLSAAEMRQLMGRQGRQSRGLANIKAANVINFNTDTEYAANEKLRNSGETVQHNPVRSIAPGKHSLKQMVNAVHTQKDALEEEFAKGRRNKKEAGGKYGW